MSILTSKNGFCKKCGAHSDGDLKAKPLPVTWDLDVLFPPPYWTHVPSDRKMKILFSIPAFSEFVAKEEDPGKLFMIRRKDKAYILYRGIYPSDVEVLAVITYAELQEAIERLDGPFPKRKTFVGLEKMFPEEVWGYVGSSTKEEILMSIPSVRDFLSRNEQFRFVHIKKVEGEPHFALTLPFFNKPAYNDSWHASIIATAQGIAGATLNALLKSGYISPAGDSFPNLTTYMSECSSIRREEGVSLEEIGIIVGLPAYENLKEKYPNVKYKARKMSTGAIVVMPVGEIYAGATCDVLYIPRDVFVTANTTQQTR